MVSVTPSFFFFFNFRGLKFLPLLSFHLFSSLLSILSQQVLFLTDKLLLKEKDRENSVTSELNEPNLQSQKQVTTSVVAEVKDVPIIVPKQEDLSSANSAIFDSDSSHYTDGGYSSLLEPADSSNVFGPEQSDLSHEEEEEDNLHRNLLPPTYHFPKLEDSIYLEPPVNSCNYTIPVEDEPCWYWP